MVDVTFELAPVNYRAPTVFVPGHEPVKTDSNVSTNKSYGQLDCAQISQSALDRAKEAANLRAIGIVLDATNRTVALLNMYYQNNDQYQSGYAMGQATEKVFRVTETARDQIRGLLAEATTEKSKAISAVLTVSNRDLETVTNRWNSWGAKSNDRFYKAQFWNDFLASYTSLAFTIRGILEK